MNSKVKVQTNKVKLDMRLRQSSIFRLNLDMSLAGLSWPLFIGGQVSGNRSGSIQTRRILVVYSFHIRIQYTSTST
jgi:hypothetical protein